MNNFSYAPAAPPITDTERLEFLERQNLKFETHTATDPDYKVFMFGGQGVKTFIGRSAREAIDSAIHAWKASP